MMPPAEQPLTTKQRSLACKLILLTLASTAAIFFAAFSYNYYCSRTTVIKGVEENAGNLTRSTVHKIESVLMGVAKVPRNLATLIERIHFEELNLLYLLQSTVFANPEIYGSAIAFEPYAYSPEKRYFAPYCYRLNDKHTRVIFLGGDTYQYFYMDWYQIPRELKHAIWSEPYYDEGGGNAIMATFSVPFYQDIDGARTFRGIVTADISLTWLREIVSSVKIYDSGYAFLISRNGVFVTHPEQKLVMKSSIFSLAECAGSERLRQIGKEMIKGQEGFVALDDPVSGKRSWMYFAPLRASGWSLGVIFPERELFADMNTLSQMVILIGLAGFVLLFAAVAFISRAITRPLRSLADTTREIARGNLDIELPEASCNDEIGALTNSFRDMKIALKEYINNLAATTAAKERIESELKIARSIQMSFLPRQFPPFPDQDAFEIFATLEPAREVGGDLYDFFLLDEDHLFFAIGDVSDKGVPAALFMAVTKTLLKGLAESGSDPAAVLSKVNQELCQENDSMMFVTVFCAILNISSGELWYSNGGHEPPLLLRRGERPEQLQIPEGFLLGAIEDSAYHTQRLRLHPGDMLLAYTDGVTEAMDKELQMYSRTRLIETLSPGSLVSAEATVQQVIRSVKEFSTGAVQSDDITILALRFVGRKTPR